MKASNIRIGDWLNIYNFPNDNPKQDDLFPAKLSAVFIFEPFKEPDVADVELIFKNKEGGNAIASRPLDTCLPIILTEDILEKNSIKISSFTGTLYWFDEDEQCCVKPIEDRFMFMYSKGADYLTFRITYVHQLQHLLRTVGVQKEIEL